MKIAYGQNFILYFIRNYNFIFMMDLFIINRYQESDEELCPDNKESDHLIQLQRKIEERKRNKSITVPSKQDSEISDHKSETKSDKVSVDNIKTEDYISTDNLDTDPNQRKPKQKALAEFQILGKSKIEKKIFVKRVLPYWLSHPKLIPKNLKDLKYKVEDQEWLHITMQSKLLSEGITHLFPVQHKVIPFILNEHKLPNIYWPHDVCVCAPTGSGKTLSFVLPIIQVLMNEIGCHIRALVVLPVQELANQVAKVFKKYCMKTGLKVVLLSGSTPMHLEQQQIVRFTSSAGWISESDIIVCTAGRLVEHLQHTQGFSLKYLKFLVIDEADRIMDHIQNDWLYHLEGHIKLGNQLMMGKMPNLNWSCLNEQPRPPQKLLFSATLSQDPEKLEQWGLFQPKLFSSIQSNEYEDDESIVKYVTPNELTEQYITCSAEVKPLILYLFLNEYNWDKVLCFTNSSQTAHRLTTLLNNWGSNKLKAVELSAALDRSTRETVLKKFTQSDINILIGTDALARGIDIPNCNYVVSYDAPRNIKTYIHRVGRTGRAGNAGNAITILLPNQVTWFKNLLQSGGKSDIHEMEIKQETYMHLFESYEHAIQKTKNDINSENVLKVQKSVSLKRGKRLRTDTNFNK